MISPPQTRVLEETARDLVITRIFNAPRELVFKAWTTPALLRNWWGPTHHPASVVEMDVRPGGRWRNCLVSQETGAELWQGGIFREVDPPKRLAFTFKWDAAGERGIETLVTITFDDEGGKTRMVFAQTPFQSQLEREGHREGWASSFDRLDAELVRRI